MSATLQWKPIYHIFDARMTALISGLQGNCLSSQRKLLASLKERHQ